MKKALVRALSKCQRYRDNELSVYCTPSEYFLLYKHFGIDPAKADTHWYEYMLNHKKTGYCRPSWHYITIPRKKAFEFPKSEWYR